MYCNILLVLFISYLLIKLWHKYKPKVLVTSTGKAVVITGCDTGFGHRLALRLNERGFRVYATVISESSAGAQQLTSKAQFAHKMHVIGMDVTKHDQVQKAYDYVTLHLNEKSYGDCLWALVNNAGVTSEGPIEWGSPEQYELVFAVNMFGPIRVTRTFLPLIRASKGRVVNMVSIMGRFSVSPFVWYCMTKHALTAFSDTLRQEMRSFGVRVVTVEPAGFSTGLADESNRFTAVCRLWRQTAPEIQNAYGYNSESDLKKLLAKSTDKFKPSPNLDIVVNDLCDAVHNAEPRVRYTPVDGIVAKILVAIVMHIPSEWLDRIFWLTDNSAK